MAADGSPWFSVDTVFGAGVEADDGYADICSTTVDLEPATCTTVDGQDIPGGHASGGPTLGPDGAMWFTNKFERFIGRMPTSGPRSFTRYKLPRASDPEAITAGPDGALWFADGERGMIGRITTTGAVTFFPLPSSRNRPRGITAGPDGAVWFTEGAPEANAVRRITPTGDVTEFRIPTPDSGPGAITLGPDGALWFVENRANKIGRIVPPGASGGPAPSTPPQAAAPGGQPAEPPASRPATTPSGAPRVTRLRLRVAPRRRGTSHRRRPGRNLHYALTDSGRVEIRVRRGGRTIAVRTLEASAGANTTPLGAVIGRRALRSGRYRVTVSPIGRDGSRGRSRSVGLLVRG